jgi:hypothetical protein
MTQRREKEVYLPLAGGKSYTNPSVPTGTGFRHVTLGVEDSAAIVPTTADIPDSTNKRYCTDSEKTVIGNTSNTNTGDQTLTSLNGAAIGTATTNRVSYWTDGATLGSSLIEVNGTLFRLNGSSWEIYDGPNSWGATMAITCLRTGGDTWTLISTGGDAGEGQGKLLIKSGHSGNIIICDASGRVGIKIVSPTAQLHLPAGSNNAGTAPLKITSGSLLTTPEPGAIEFDGIHFYGTDSGGNRKQLDN